MLNKVEVDTRSLTLVDKGCRVYVSGTHFLIYFGNSHSYCSYIL